MGKADVETVKEVGELFLKCLKGEGKLPRKWMTLKHTFDTKLLI